MKKSIPLLFAILISSQVTADEALNKKAIGEFNSCVMRNLSNENNFEASVATCTAQNNKEYKDIVLKFEIIKNKENGGFGFIKTKNIKSMPAAFELGGGVQNKCTDCLTADSGVHDGRELSKAVLNTTIKQGVPAQLLKAALGPRPQCEPGFEFKDGQCEKECADKSQVFNGRKYGKTGSIKVGECKSCDSVFDEYEKYAKTVDRKFKRPKGLHSNETTNDCLDEHNCSAESEDWDAKHGKCIPRCLDTEEYVEASGYGYGHCQKKKNGCEAEHAEALNKSIKNVPDFVLKFKDLGCNTSKHISIYRQEYSKHLEAALKQCKDIQSGDWVNGNGWNTGYSSMVGLGNVLINDCAVDLGIRPNDLSKKINLAPFELLYPYPVDFDSWPPYGGVGSGMLGGGGMGYSGMGNYPSPPIPGPSKKPY